MEVLVAFKEFISRQTVRSDAQGDFLRLAKADPMLPDFTAWADLSAYIERRRGFDAVAAGRVVWEAYEAKLREAARHAKRT
jgi:hypothetical protein